MRQQPAQMLVVQGLLLESMLMQATINPGDLKAIRLNTVYPGDGFRGGGVVMRECGSAGIGMNPNPAYRDRYNQSWSDCWAFFVSASRPSRTGIYYSGRAP